MGTFYQLPDRLNLCFYEESDSIITFDGINRKITLDSKINKDEIIYLIKDTIEFQELITDYKNNLQPINEFINLFLYVRKNYFKKYNFILKYKFLIK